MRSPLVRHTVLMLDSAPAGLGGLAAALARTGHVLAHVATVAELLAELSGRGTASAVDLLLARPAGPPRAGLDLLRQLRRVSLVPCILVAATADDVAERVLALQLGADDYWPRGMAPEEMLARAQALLRRLARDGTDPAAVPARAAQGTAPLPILVGGWRLLPQRRMLVAADRHLSIRLTGAEFEFLRLLALAGGEPVDRDVISRAVFRRPWRVEDRAVDGLVKRLRRKLEEDAIATVRGVGYALLGAIQAEEGAAKPAQRMDGPEHGGRSPQPQVEICAPIANNSPRG